MTKAQRKLKKAKVCTSLCVGCGCCVNVCELSAVEIYKRIYTLVDIEKCVGCSKCVHVYPASVIEIREAVGA